MPLHHSSNGGGITTLYMFMYRISLCKIPRFILFQLKLECSIPCCEFHKMRIIVRNHLMLHHSHYQVLADIRTCPSDLDEVRLVSLIRRHELSDRESLFVYISRMERSTTVNHDHLQLYMVYFNPKHWTSLYF